ncbi:putative disease resistance protein RGA4 [Humulus lupulus]|uniref:putative disease resistance protein RGA4 n=1 Tax=Humulus lupulus TaxID=3486 RepID=UPI002B40F87A|nr:putative disease resistance protein RGA4 [Humulus lupulus]
MRSFFQNFENNDLDGGIRSFKMHDIVHDFAQFLTKNECITLEVDHGEDKLVSLDEKSHHLSIVVQSGTKFPAPNYNKLNEKNIRSLFIVQSRRLFIDSSLFSQLMFLRKLSLIECSLEMLEESIGQLIHFRYLNLRRNFNLKRLLEGICNLCNLQTLNLSRCFSIKRLPEGIGKLVKLKHLYIDGCDLEGLPRGISGLSCLQRNFKNATEAENLGRKNIAVSRGDGLELDFRKLKKECGFEDDSDTLETLEPDPYLKTLIIWNYIGLVMSRS